MDVLGWGKSADSNNENPPNGFPEQQAPRSFNNSAREVMAAIRRHFHLVGGELVSTGTATAFALSVPGDYTEWPNDFLIAFKAHRDNSGAATMRVSALHSGITTLLGSVDLKSNNKDLPAGAIKQNGIYLIAKVSDHIEVLNPTVLSTTPDATDAYWITPYI